MVPIYLLLLCYPFVCKYGYELYLMLDKDAWPIESCMLLVAMHSHIMFRDPIISKKTTIFCYTTLIASVYKKCETLAHQHRSRIKRQSSEWWREEPLIVKWCLSNHKKAKDH